MTSTDLSYSRLGLNFIGAMPAYWGGCAASPTTTPRPS